jgi:hypothetical protein
VCSVARARWQITHKHFRIDKSALPPSLPSLLSLSLFGSLSELMSTTERHMTYPKINAEHDPKAASRFNARHIIEEGSSLTDGTMLSRSCIQHAASSMRRPQRRRQIRRLCRCRTIFGTLSCDYFTGPVGYSIGPPGTLPFPSRQSSLLPSETEPDYF